MLQGLDGADPATAGSRNVLERLIEDESSDDNVPLQLGQRVQARSQPLKRESLDRDLCWIDGNVRLHHLQSPLARRLAKTVGDFVAGDSEQPAFEPVPAVIAEPVNRLDGRGEDFLREVIRAGLIAEVSEAVSPHQVMKLVENAVPGLLISAPCSSNTRGDLVPSQHHPLTQHVCERYPTRSPSARFREDFQLSTAG